MPLAANSPEIEGLEFDVIDQLYFIKSYQDLLADLADEPEEEVRAAVWSLINKGYIRSAAVQDGVAHHLPATDEELAQTHLLATKEGLLKVHQG